ncbi:MAG TPA: HlyD family efflux transporter periplasmic adaptor subunit [Anaerolineales bacterium]|nr:HlyD family efflux transporter periplasmic adaptor subunit [Anaerolineales bacterium]
MRQVYRATWLTLTAILALLVKPVFAAQGGTVVASAIVVPAQTSKMAFLLSAPVKEVAVDEGDEVTSGQMLIALNAPDLEYGVIASEAVLGSAQANAEIQRYNRVKDRRNGRVFFNIVPPEVRQKADAEVVSAQAALEVAQATLARSVLVAPYNATVASVNVVPGEYVQQNQVVMTLATLNNLQLETTDLSERDITKVKIGSSVNIFIEASNENITGKVIEISPRANTVGGDVVFKVTIAFDQQPQNLLWGMTAEVTFEE